MDSARWAGPAGRGPSPVSFLGVSVSAREHKRCYDAVEYDVEDMVILDCSTKTMAECLPAFFAHIVLETEETTLIVERGDSTRPGASDNIFPSGLGLSSPQTANTLLPSSLGDERWELGTKHGAKVGEPERMGK